MRTIEHSLEIAASPDAVWRVLADTDSYEEWNPFITRLIGDLRIGSQVLVAIRPGERRMTFRPTITAVEFGRTLQWRGRLGIRGLFDGCHEFHLQALPDGGTRFTQRERFSGILVPFLSKVLNDTEVGFGAMNNALMMRVRKMSAGV